MEPAPSPQPIPHSARDVENIAGARSAFADATPDCRRADAEGVTKDFGGQLRNEYAAIVHRYTAASDTVASRNFNIRTAIFPYVGTVVTRFASSGKAGDGLADSPATPSRPVFHAFPTPHVENHDNPHRGITSSLRLSPQDSGFPQCGYVAGRGLPARRRIGRLVSCGPLGRGTRDTVSSAPDIH